MSRTRTMASIKIAWQVEDKGEFQIAFWWKGRKWWWWSGGKREGARGGIYIVGRENMLLFVCGLVPKFLRRLANSCDLNLEVIKNLEGGQKCKVR